jgi:hypothetical protein
VRTDEHVAHSPKRTFRRQRLAFENIQRCSGDFPLRERADQIRFDHSPASPDIDENGARLHCGEGHRVKHAARALRERQRTDDIIRSAQRIVPILLAMHLVDSGMGTCSVAADADRLHAELFRALGDHGSDLADADERDSLSEQLCGEKFLVLPRGLLLDHSAKAFGVEKHRPERKFRHRVPVDALGAGNCNTTLIEPRLPEMIDTGTGEL